MNQTATISIPFAAEAGDGESRWIRVEQVEQADEGATLEQAADLIDALYGLEPCEDGLGTGGAAADEEDLPEEEDFLEMARDRLDLGICREAPWWEAQVDVMRSHQDDGYSLESESAEIGETEIIRKTVTETVELDGNSYDLQWPYAGGIAVSGAGAAVLNVRGSTVNFAAPVTGRAHLTYRAVWDRVTVRVRRVTGASSTGGVVLASGAASVSKRARAAAVIAFWRDLAASCELSEPPADDDLDQAEIERLCHPKRSLTVKGECWQTIEKYNICNCSGREAKDAPEPEDVDAPCPDGVRPGSWLGTVRQLVGYVDCDKEDEGLADPEFFREHCCEDEPRADLPRCAETREPYRGGAEIEGGPEKYKNLYGENVRLVAVAPEGGSCGELVRVWAVPEALEGPPVLPESLVVDRGQTFTVTVTSGGRAPFTWATPAGVHHLGDAAYGFMGIFQADASFTGGALTVTDACGREVGTRLDVMSEIECRWVDLTGDFDRLWPPDSRYGYADPLTLGLPGGSPYDLDFDLLCGDFALKFPLILRSCLGNRFNTQSACSAYSRRGDAGAASCLLFSPTREYAALMFVVYRVNVEMYKHDGEGFFPCPYTYDLGVMSSRAWREQVGSEDADELCVYLSALFRRVCE